MRNYTHSRLSSALATLLLVAACSEPSTDRESRTLSALNAEALAMPVGSYAEVAGSVLLADQARPASLANCDPLAQNCPTGEMCVIASFSSSAGSGKSAAGRWARNDNCPHPGRLFVRRH